jgi:hypothetical protein
MSYSTSITGAEASGLVGIACATMTQVEQRQGREGLPEMGAFALLSSLPFCGHVGK